MKILKATLLGLTFSVLAAGAAVAGEKPCCKDGAPCCEKEDGKLPACCEDKAAPKPGDTKPAPGDHHEHAH